MEPEVKVETVPTEPVQVAPKVTPVPEPSQKTKTSTELLKEYSKSFGVNLFEDSGWEELRTKQESLSGTNKSLQEKLDAVVKEQSQFTQKELDYQTKIEALGMGFSLDNMDEVLALAKVNTKADQTIADGLKVVKEKYGKVFVGGSNIGLQHNDNKGDKLEIAKTEQEKFMAQDPLYAKYNKNKK